MLKQILHLKLFYPAILVCFFDQLSKFLIRINFEECTSHFCESINIMGEYIKFTYLINPGLAFGTPINHQWMYMLLFIITIIITVYIIYYMISNTELIYFEVLALSLILGGALGNLIDRGLTLFQIDGYKGVIDFIDIGFGAYRWYIFNVADMSVSIGIGLYLFCSYFCSKSNKKVEDEVS